jgi:LEA14-like dessication related protein
MIKRILILILALLSLSACFEPSPPKVNYQDYQISRVTLEGIEVSFNFEVDNPNPLGIDISSYAYKVFINDREFLSEKRAGFNLPASNKKKIAIPVNIRYDRLFGSAASVAERLLKGENKIDYRIEGNMNAGVMGVTLGIPIKASGTIPLPKDIKF